MTFGGLFKAFDTMMALRDAAKRLKGKGSSDSALVETGSGTQAATGSIEARLTGVVVAALKEAFDRDHARLELERAQLEEQRRRAEETLRIELHRQAVDREQGRLRFLAGTALVGWMTSLVALGSRIGVITGPARVVLGCGWLLLLGALASAFAAQTRVSAYVADGRTPFESGMIAHASLWLLIAGFALTALSVLL
jgi:hypothetical protein